MIKKIQKVCLEIANITDEDFEEVDALVEYQLNYSNQYDIEKEARANLIGARNRKIVQKLRELKLMIEQ